MSERLSTPEELFNFKFGAAPKGEHTVFEMLDDNAKAAQSSELERLFRHHQGETREQIAYLEEAFAALGWEVDDSPYPAIEAIEKEGEHHEIAVYEVSSPTPLPWAGRRRRAPHTEPRAGAAHA